MSGAYRVSQDFHIPGVDELKLRVSHGTAGLRPPFIAQYEVFALQGGLPAPVTLGNNELKPAFSRETEYGFNINFLTQLLARLQLLAEADDGRDHPGSAVERHRLRRSVSERRHAVGQIARAGVRRSADVEGEFLLARQHHGGPHASDVSKT